MEIILKIHHVLNKETFLSTLNSIENSMCLSLVILQLFEKYLLPLKSATDINRLSVFLSTVVYYLISYLFIWIFR
jgi:hypothetical protein